MPDTYTYTEKDFNMKVRFAALFLAGMALMSVQVSGAELRWKSPSKESAPVVIPSEVSTMADESDGLATDLEFPIVLVQYTDETAPAQELKLAERTSISKPDGVPTRSTVKKTPCDAELKPITAISYDIRRKTEELPEECRAGYDDYTGRHFGRTCYAWKASNVSTKAAYFEDVQLDRYGHSACPVLEPVISGAKFFATIPLLPYYAGVTPPGECVYTLGHYRAGNCAPYMIQPFPISLRGAAAEAGAIGAGIAILP
jgi:hypothetical protein